MNWDNAISVDEQYSFLGFPQNEYIIFLVNILWTNPLIFKNFKAPIRISSAVFVSLTRIPSL